MVTYNNTTDNYGPSSFIVDLTAGKGNYTSIAAAITAASAVAVSTSNAQTVFMRPAIYAENLTLQPNVNLTAWPTDGYNDAVVIKGKCTFTQAGSVVISGVELRTNSDFAIAITGSAASVVNLVNCNLNCLNNTGISFTSSSASSAFSMQESVGNIGTTGIAIFAFSSAGVSNFVNCFFTNSGASTTASTISAGSLGILFSEFLNPITTSGTSIFSMSSGSYLSTQAQNTTALTIGGSGAQSIFQMAIASGSASCISISSALGIGNVNLSSSNAAVITGAGTANYSVISYGSTGHLNNVTAQSGGSISGMQNTSATNTVGAGFIGEQIRSTTTGLSISSNTTINLTTISLTAGIWDVSAVATFTSSGATNQNTQLTINTTSSTQGTDGDNRVWGSLAVNGVAEGGASIPAWRFTTTSTTTVYLVATVAFTSGSMTTAGRISATRVG